MSDRSYDPTSASARAEAESWRQPYRRIEYIDADSGPDLLEWHPVSPTRRKDRAMDSSKVELWMAAVHDALINGPEPRFPAQPPVGTVLRYNRTFDRKQADPKTYDYVALRAETGWHVTGRENSVLTFEQLVERIGDNDCAMVVEYQVLPRAKANPLDAIEDPRDWIRAVFADRNTDVPPTTGE